MCEFKTDEHKMTVADVRRIANGIVWNNSPAAIAEDASAVVSMVLANIGRDYRYGSDGMYWQPDPSHYYNDYHRVTDGQFARIVEEADKQAQRVSKLLHHPATAS